MGLTIFYKGSFKQKASLQELIEEVTDIAVANDWPYTVFEKEFPPNNLGQKEFNDEMYGIVFSPPKCEPVFLTFLSNGVMANTIYLEHHKSFKSGPSIAVKTQYAGPAVHVVVVNLLKYLNSKYFLNFEVFDETEYWETGSEKKMLEHFERMGLLLDSFANMLSGLKRKKGESVEDAIKRAAEQMNLKLKKKRKD
jgi:hypothetical protein